MQTDITPFSKFIVKKKLLKKDKALKEDFAMQMEKKNNKTSLLIKTIYTDQKAQTSCKKLLEIF